MSTQQASDERSVAPVSGAGRSGPLRVALVALLTGIVTFLALLLTLAAVSAPATEGAPAPSIHRDGKQLRANTANARASGDGILVANRNEAPLTILAAEVPPFRAVDYGVISVASGELARGLEVALIWVRTDDPRQPHEQRIEVSAGRLLPTTLDTNPEWRGNVRFLALGVKGVVDRPLEIRGLSLEPLTVSGVAADALRSWRQFEGWDGRSINVVFGGRELQRIWLPALLFTASLASAIAARFAARRLGRRLSFAALAVPFIVGWMVADVRWLSNLIPQASATLAEFGGRTIEQRHLAMEDGDLYRFTQAALAQLPKEPVRIFATSDFEYFRRRAGYHLYPHNVLAYNWAEPGIIRPGEYVFFYQKADVRFDARAGELQWSNGRRLAARSLVAQRGAGLFVATEPSR